MAGAGGTTFRRASSVAVAMLLTFRMRGACACLHAEEEKPVEVTGRRGGERERVERGHLLSYWGWERPSGWRACALGAGGGTGSAHAGGFLDENADGTSAPTQ